jgi:sugar/nucleoside kinase (ribokinase family)
VTGVAAPDFVAVGHLTLDRFGDVVRPGGSALYAAITAHRLGFSAGILTSHANDYPLELLPPAIEVVSVPSPVTTTFAHRHEGGERGLRVTEVARPLAARDVPADWQDAGVVLLAPALGEVDPLAVEAFGAATLGAAAQGWLRDRAGADVVARPWAPPPGLLSRIQVLFMGLEDVRGQESAVMEWLQRLPMVAVTAGARGGLLFVNGERYETPPRRAREVDTTGAGDVFAAAFMLRYHVEGDPWRAASAAACAASLSVEGEGFSTVPDHATLEAALRAYEG